MAKKKRAPTAQVENPVVESDTASNLSIEKEGSTEKEQVATEQESVENIPSTKNSKASKTGKINIVSLKKVRAYKSLKQLIASERSLPNAVTYLSLDSPPSLKPPKKYSDISGLKAKYTDPLTKLRYANASEFQTIRTLAPEVINAYLSLRKAAPL